jgi:hypothetical protein
LLGLYRSTAAAPRETPRFLDAGRVLGAFLGQ